MFKLTLEWQEGDHQHSRVVSSQTTYTPGTVRIGRDQSQSDVVITDSEKTVSRAHVEVFLDNQSHTLCLRNLTRDQPEAKRNPALVDQQKVILQEIPIRIGSRIQLGHAVVMIQDIEVGSQEKVAAQETSHSYGIKCHTCGNVVSYEYLGSACPYCGSTIHADDTVEFYRVSP